MLSLRLLYCVDASLVRIGHLFPRRFFALGDERFGKRVEFECTDVMEHRFFGEDRVWVANPHANQGVVGVYREFVKEGLRGDILCNDIRQSGQKTRARCVFSIKLFVPVQVRILSCVHDEGTAVVLHEDIALRHATHTHFSTVRTADLQGLGIGIKFDDL